MLSTFKTVFRIYVRKPLLPVLTFVLFLISFYFPLTSPDYWSFAETIELSLLVNAISLPVIGLLSYETINEVVDNEDTEALKAVPGLKARENVVCLILLGGILLLSSLIQFCCLVYRAHAFGLNDPLVIRHLFKAILLYAFIPGLVGICMGYAFSGDTRARSYALILIFSLLLSPLAGEAISGTLLASRYHLNEWLGIFFYNRQLGMLPDPMYGIPMETVRWVLGFFWIGAFTVYRLSRAESRSRMSGRIGLTCMAVLTGLCAIRFGLRGNDSQLLRNGAGNDVFYYPDAVMEEAPDFQVTSYRLDLRFRDTMEAKVRVSVAITEKEKTEYHFTLYHGYRVQSVTDENGKAVPFVQNGDWIDVFPEADMYDFLFTYSGTHAKYYANAQGVLLPGYVCYYPAPGHVALWTGGGAHVGYLPVLGREEVPHTLKVDSPAPIVCNLKQTGENEYGGTVDALTVLGGLIQKEEQNGLTVFCPMLRKYRSYDLREIETEWNELAGLLGTSETFKLGDEDAVYILPEFVNVYYSYFEQLFFMKNGFTQIRFTPEWDAEEIASSYALSKCRTSMQNTLLLGWFSRYLTTRFMEEGRRPDEKELAPLRYYYNTGEDPGKLMEAQLAFKQLYNYCSNYIVPKQFLPLVYHYLQEEKHEVNPVDFLVGLADTIEDGAPRYRRSEDPNEIPKVPSLKRYETCEEFEQAEHALGEDGAEYYYRLSNLPEGYTLYKIETREGMFVKLYYRADTIPEDLNPTEEQWLYGFAIETGFELLENNQLLYVEDGEGKPIYSVLDYRGKKYFYKVIDRYEEHEMKEFPWMEQRRLGYTVAEVVLGHFIQIDLPGREEIEDVLQYTELEKVMIR